MDSTCETQPTPEHILQKYFGYNSFRLTQRQIIDSILKHQDVLAILPTGGGKSLCYQIPGLLLNGTTLVISPLISLMKDQVDQLKQHHIAAAYLNSSLSEGEQLVIFTKFTAGEYKFMYVAPERLVTKKFQQACKEINIPLIAIDEAHCISQWGHDFRPEYLQIKQFILNLPLRPPILAVTATATETVRQDIIHQLGLDQPILFLSSFRRHNLDLMCHHCESQTEKTIWLLRLWQKYFGKKCLIYCSTRADTVHYAQLAQRSGYQCGNYHAGLTTQERTRIQEQFSTGKLTMVAATNAFGMGIDIPDIRLIIHLEIPHDLEGYYQEIGRAGRDGAKSACYLFYTPHDQQVQDQLFNSRFPDAKYLSYFLNQLYQLQAAKQALSDISIQKKFHNRYPKVDNRSLFHVIHVAETLGYIQTCFDHHQKSYRLVTSDPNIFQNWLRQKADALVRKAAVQQYLQSKSCRTQSILGYFGETYQTRCQQCDLCIPKIFDVPAAELATRRHYWKTLKTHAPEHSPSSSAPQFISPNLVKYLAISPIQLMKVADENVPIPGLGRGLTKYLQYFSLQPTNLRKS